MQFGGGHDDEDEGASVSRRRPWAWLLHYVWQPDVSTCPRCGGSVKWVEVATEPEAIRRVLAELDLQAADNPTPRRTAQRRYRVPPPEQLGLGFG